MNPQISWTGGGAIGTGLAQGAVLKNLKVAVNCDDPPKKIQFQRLKRRMDVNPKLVRNTSILRRIQPAILSFMLYKTISFTCSLIKVDEYLINNLD